MYELRYSREASRAIARLPALHKRRVIAAVEKLRVEPRPPGVKKLTGPNRYYRLRVGDYRVIYEVTDSEVIVYVQRVARRTDQLYRNLPRG